MATYYVKPTDGDDTKDGSSWANAWKTINHSLSPGDVVLVEKSAETQLSGTLSVNNGSTTVSTSQDLTGELSQYDIIKIDTEQTYYMVKAVSANSITLYRPFRGPNKTNVNGYKLTKHSPGGDFVVQSDGQAGNLITIKGGINTSNDSQDGLTVIDKGFDLNWKDFVRVERIGTYHDDYNWQRGDVGCEIYDCYAFRATTQNFIDFRCCKIEKLVIEVGKGFSRSWQAELKDYEYFGGGGDQAIRGTQVGLVVEGLKAGDCSEFYYASGGTACTQITVIDGHIGERSISDIIKLDDRTHLDIVFKHTKLENYTDLFEGSYDYWSGRVGFEFLNREDKHEYYIFLGHSTSKPYYAAKVEKDTTVYKSAAPSAKITPREGKAYACIAHLIPCEANQQKTVSVWLRKNSSYGSSNRPKMVVGYWTGTLPNLTWNEEEAVMSDVNDTWEQVSKTVTPSVKGAIVVKICVCSANAGAAAWYDDLEVQ